jgi:hypothetical protein
MHNFKRHTQRIILAGTILILLFSVSPKLSYSQIGKSIGIEGGFCSGGITGFSGQNGLFTGAIFKEFMAYNKKLAREKDMVKPTYGLEIKLNWSYYSVNAGGMNIYTLPVTFKVNLGSSMIEQRVAYDAKTNTRTHYYTRYFAVYLYGGPEAGYLQTGIKSTSGSQSPAFAGAVGGVQIWFNRFKIDIYGHRSLTSVFKPGNNYVEGGAVAFGVAF